MLKRAAPELCRGDFGRVGMGLGGLAKAVYGFA